MFNSSLKDAQCFEISGASAPKGRIKSNVRQLILSDGLCAGRGAQVWREGYGIGIALKFEGVRGDAKCFVGSFSGAENDRKSFEGFCGGFSLEGKMAEFCVRIRPPRRTGHRPRAGDVGLGQQTHLEQGIAESLVGFFELAGSSGLASVDENLGGQP